MRRRVAAIVFAGLLGLAAASPVVANTGYEGQPGNQSNGGGGGGNTGYEGQPGNQSHN